MARPVWYRTPSGIQIRGIGFQPVCFLLQPDRQGLSHERIIREYALGEREQLGEKRAAWPVYAGRSAGAVHLRGYLGAKLTAACAASYT